MKFSMKTLITATLLSIMLISLQFCKKKDVTPKQDSKAANLIAELSSKPQLVLKKILLTDEDIKQLVASTRSRSAKMMGCPGTLYSAVVGYTLTYLGSSSGCASADYKVDALYLVWSDSQTDDGPRDHDNPDPSVSGVSLTINSNTVNPESVLYNVGDDKLWYCTFGFRYSDVGLSVSTTSISSTIHATFNCSGAGSTNYNNGHTLGLDACDSQGVIYPNPIATGQADIIFPWDLTCYTGMAPSAGWEMKYRPQGSSGSYTTLSSSILPIGPWHVYDSPGSYEYLSRYGCTGGVWGPWYNGIMYIPN